MCTLFKRQVEHRPVEQILINTSREETRVAILDDGLLQDLFIERACARGLVGNVYWGQVVRVLPGMQSAFLVWSVRHFCTLQRLKEPERTLAHSSR